MAKKRKPERELTARERVAKAFPGPKPTEVELSRRGRKTRTTNYRTLPAQTVAGVELSRAEMLDDAQQKAVALYAIGYTRVDIARKLWKLIAPNHTDPIKGAKQARARLRGWEKRKEFRDAIFSTAVVEVDLQSGAILQGITKSAKRGRVDAAKFALEVADRYSPRGEEQKPAQINIVFPGLPRPFDIEGEAVEETAEETDGS